jgi:hypothetical protein
MISNFELYGTTPLLSITLLAQHHVFRILPVTSDLQVTFLHPSLDMGYALLILLRSNDLIP